MLNKKRKDYIADIVRYGVDVSIIVPTTVLNEKTLEPDSFKVLRDSLEVLQEDPQLTVEITDLEDDLTNINITVKPNEPEVEIEIPSEPNDD